MDTRPNAEGAVRTAPEGQQTVHTTSQGLVQTTSIGEQYFRTSSSLAKLAEDGIRRTSSGVETYYPDGHASIQPFCAHEESEETKSTSPTSRASYTLFPTKSKRQSSSSRDTPGAGLFSGDNGRETYASNESDARQLEEAVPLQPAEELESLSSSDSSTRFGSNGQRRDKQRQGSSTSAEVPGHTLERRVTRSEIDDNGRRELRRIFTSQSQRITQQMSIAQPGDASVDPASESFDLSKFLRMCVPHLDRYT
jgi:ATP-binding cassette subfamily G (WHITE) protein 2 (PDR)